MEVVVRFKGQKEQEGRRRRRRRRGLAGNP